MPYNFFISPTGWLTVSEQQSFSIFSPANKLIDKIHYSSIPAYNSIKNDYKINLGSGISIRIFALNEKEYIIPGSTAAFENYNEENKYYDYLFYTDADKLSVLAKYQNEDIFIFPGGLNGVSMLGTLRFAIISSSKILYTHTFHDVTFANTTAQLTFHIVSPAGNIASEFSVTYQLEAIPDSVIKSFNPSYVEKSNKELRGSSYKMSKEEKDMCNRIVNALEQRKYKPPFTALQSDGAYIFLINDKVESGSKKYIFTVINSESGKEVSRFITSESISGDIIKNSYRYVLTTPKDGYPVVQKYRIDPRVYGK